MRRLRVESFDSVITIDNAIGHLVKSDFNIAISNIHQSLNQGGIYVFDILDLDAVTDEVIHANSEKMTNVIITEDGTRINNV